MTESLNPNVPCGGLSMSVSAEVDGKQNKGGMKSANRHSAPV
jgi:hypothetical protein